MQKVFHAISIVLVLLASAMPASTQEATHVIGTIERAEGDKFVVKQGNGASLTVTLAEPADQRTPEQKWIATKAKAFLEYQYAEIKDLAKQFLIVIAGILTLTITFSEKIVNIATASKCTKRMLTAIWFCCLAAFVLGGAAIFVIYNAGIFAKAATIEYEVYKVALLPLPCVPELTYRGMLILSQWILTIAGVIFAAALGLLVLVGKASLNAAKAEPKTPERQA